MRNRTWSSHLRRTQTLVQWLLASMTPSKLEDFLGSPGSPSDSKSNTIPAISCHNFLCSNQFGSLHSSQFGGGCLASIASISATPSTSQPPLATPPAAKSLPFTAPSGFSHYHHHIQPPASHTHCSTPTAAHQLNTSTLLTTTPAH